MPIVLCEKPSQARNVEAAIGGRFGQVFAARGHLLRLAEPHEVEERWKQWSYEVLRPPKGFYPLRPDSGGGKDQVLARIKAAIASTDRVVIATDCDREGQAIGENLVRFLRFRGPVFRVMFSAEDPQTIAAAFEAMEPNEKYRGLYNAAVARAQADQIVNLTTTRVVTLALKPPSMRGALGIGRVKTPTMAIVCCRERELGAFVPQPYLDLWVDVANDGAFARLLHSPKEPLLTDEDAADEIVRGLRGCCRRS